MRVEIITQPSGCYKAHLSDSPDWNVFRSIANTMLKMFDGKVVERIDGLDQRYWDIGIRGIILTLRSETFLGISLYSRDKHANAVITEVGKYLEMAKADLS